MASKDNRLAGEARDELIAEKDAIEVHPSTRTDELPAAEVDREFHVARDAPLADLRGVRDFRDFQTRRFAGSPRQYESTLESSDLRRQISPAESSSDESPAETERMLSVSDAELAVEVGAAVEPAILRELREIGNEEREERGGEGHLAGVDPKLEFERPAAVGLFRRESATTGDRHARRARWTQRATEGEGAIGILGEGELEIVETLVGRTRGRPDPHPTTANDDLGQALAHRTRWALTRPGDPLEIPADVVVFREHVHVLENENPRTRLAGEERREARQDHVHGSDLNDGFPALWIEDPQVPQASAGRKAQLQFTQLEGPGERLAQSGANSCLERVSPEGQARVDEEPGDENQGDPDRDEQPAPALTRSTHPHVGARRGLGGLRSRLLRPAATRSTSSSSRCSPSLRSRLSSPLRKGFEWPIEWISARIEAPERGRSQFGAECFFNGLLALGS